MDWIWEKTLEFWCSFFGDQEEESVPTSSPELQSTRRISRVRFSRSTIQQFQLHELQQLGSTNAFFNFLLVQRMRQRNTYGTRWMRRNGSPT
nr:uncharacterized protein LOC108059024 isoform X2 [Drosophila takahashii]